MLKSVIRTLTFTSNWTALVLRQPSMILTMIAGPFLILFLFGIGIVSTQPPPDTIVITPGPPQESPIGVSPEDLSGYLNVVEVTDDLRHALAELNARRIRLVLLLPESPHETIQSGRQATIIAFVNEIDPVGLAFIRIDIRAQMAVVNNEIEAQAIDAAKRQARELLPRLAQIEQMLLESGVSAQDITRARQAVDTLLGIPTELLVSPFEVEIIEIAPLKPTVVTFFTPGAIALVIQHLAVTLAGLSMVRARLLGITVLWQIAPVRLGEIIAGNYFSYGILTLLISATLIAAVTWALATPVLGSPVLLSLSIVLLVFASLGIGFVISLAATNEQTAAQMAMIVLLASIFLGGFFQSIESITFPVRGVSYLLPATYGVQLIQDIMLRGQQGAIIHYYALGVIGVVGLIATYRLFHRELRPT